MVEGWEALGVHLVGCLNLVMKHLGALDPEHALTVGNQ